MQTIFKQPLFHFLVLGVAIFALNAAVNDEPPAPDKPVIAVSTQDAAWLAEQFAATWRRPPTAEELGGLMDEFVREEIYVREALLLGLDQGDAIVRRRLRQKMEFLTEAGAAAASPTEEVLRAHFAENASKFERAPHLAFTQVMVPAGPEGTVEALRAALDAGVSPDSLGERTLLPVGMALSPQQAVDGTFGAGFFESLRAMPQSTWSGPVMSGYGSHLVRLDAFEEGVLPPFEELREAVELDWRAEMAATLRAARFEGLRNQYEVERPDPAAVLAQ